MIGTKNKGLVVVFPATKTLLMLTRSIFFLHKNRVYSLIVKRNTYQRLLLATSRCLLLAVACKSHVQRIQCLKWIIKGVEISITEIMFIQNTSTY